MWRGLSELAFWRSSSNPEFLPNSFWLFTQFSYVFFDWNRNCQDNWLSALINQVLGEFFWHKFVPSSFIWQVGNMIFWFIFSILGQPMCVLLYYHDLMNRKGKTELSWWYQYIKNLCWRSMGRRLLVLCRLVYVILFNHDYSYAQIDRAETDIFIHMI